MFPVDKATTGAAKARISGHRVVVDGENLETLLAAGPGGSDLFILGPDEGAEPGMRVK